MKKLYFLFLILPCISLGQDYTKIYYNENWEGTSQKKSTYYRISGFNDSLMVFDGKVEDKFAGNDKTEMIGFYKDGKKDGEFIFYYPDGNIKLIANFAVNERDGTWKEFYPNGILKLEVRYIDNIELLIHMNDENGNSILHGNKVKFKQKGLTMDGQVLDQCRQGKWKIRSEELGLAKLKYDRGKLVKGSLAKDGIETDVFYNGAFPLINDPTKFYTTESLIFEPGAIIKNNYILESIHKNKYLGADKLTIDTKEEFEIFINEELELTNTKEESVVKIIFTIADSKPIRCTTQPKISNHSLNDLKLIIGMIDKLDFISQGIIEMDYKIELEERQFDQ